MSYNMLYAQTSVICIIFLIVLYLFNLKSEHGTPNYFVRSIYKLAILMVITDSAGIFVNHFAFCIVKGVCFFAIIVMWLLNVIKECKNETDTPTKSIVIPQLIYAIPALVFTTYTLTAGGGYIPAAYGVSMSLMVSIIDRQNKILFTDNLTKLQNRYGMDEEIEVQLDQYEKNPKDSFYTIVCDLDNFKTINDTWGHLEGDRALKLVANTLTDVAKKYDSTAFRMGGDEFVIITDKSNPGLADEICAEIAQRFENLNFRDDFEIKMSMGVSLYDGKHSIEQLIQSADSILYEMKRKGKEC